MQSTDGVFTAYRDQVFFYVSDMHDTLSQIEWMCH